MLRTREVLGSSLGPETSCPECFVVFMSPFGKCQMLGLRSWWATAMNGEEWRKLLKEAKTLYELVVSMMMMMMI
jgi:hypothetical protein